MIFHRSGGTRPTVHRFRPDRPIEGHRTQSVHMDRLVLDRPPTVVVTADVELLDDVLSVAAAAGVEPHVAADAGSVRPIWMTAAMIIVGVDQAARIAAMVLPRRADVYVVGHDAARDQVFDWSVPLGAAVLLLPSGSSWLTTAMADASGLRIGTAQLWAVVGGSGGVGASTLAAGLAMVAAQAGDRAMLVDADPLGGGIDLLIGAERIDGWRWPRLTGARGHLGDLAGQLPRVDGVDVLSMSRGEHDPQPDAEQMKAVLSSAARSHDLAVVDVPRALTAAGREALRRADAVMLLVQADLRGIAAGRQIARQLDDACTALGVLVRTTRSAGVGAHAVAEGLELPLLGTVSDDPSLRTAVERGDPPGRAGRSPLARTCRALLDQSAVGRRAA